MDQKLNDTSAQMLPHLNLPTAPLWTVDDVAAYLQLQPETIRSMARRGELPGLKIGKVWRFQNNAIREMLTNTE
jgi:excisionase family DNA binding protein